MKEILFLQKEYWEPVQINIINGFYWDINVYNLISPLGDQLEIIQDELIMSIPPEIAN